MCCGVLGDLWSYNRESDSFVVSPEPDVSVHDLDCKVHRCVIVASDGVWNMVSASDAVTFVERWLHQRDTMLALVSTLLTLMAGIDLARHRRHRRFSDESWFLNPT